MLDKKDRTQGIIKRGAKWLAMLICVPLIAFLLSAWFGSMIPRNSDWIEPQDGVEILIASNGIHTEIVMPIANKTINWTSEFPLSDIGDPTRDYTHVSVSWGERAFFLETPTWADVNPTTVVNAMIGGEGIVHVAWYVRPAPDDDVRPMTISREEYAALVAEMRAQLAPMTERTLYKGYANNDVFYAAMGTYHLGNTCNQWTSDRLAAAGIATGLWTPLPGGVMKWVPPLSRD